ASTPPAPRTWRPSRASWPRPPHADPRRCGPALPGPHRPGPLLLGGEALTRSVRRWGPPVLLLAPSMVLVAVFVYGLIAVNVRTSMTDNHTAPQATGQTPVSFV